MQRFIAAATAFLIATSSAPSYAGDLTASVERAALAAAAQARPNARGSNDDNPYFIPAMVLLGGGALVSLYGLTHTTGVECSSVAFGTSCGLTKSKTTIFTGVGLAGAGAYLYYRGRATSAPQILAGPGTLGVRQQVRW